MNGIVNLFRDSNQHYSIERNVVQFSDSSTGSHCCTVYLHVNQMFTFYYYPRKNSGEGMMDHFLASLAQSVSQHSVSHHNPQVRCFSTTTKRKKKWLGGERGKPERTRFLFLFSGKCLFPLFLFFGG